MSRPSHRKSQSTSALSFIASAPAQPPLLPSQQTASQTSQTPAPRTQRDRSKSSRPNLSRSVEGEESSSQTSVLSGLAGMVDDRRRERGDVIGKRGRGEGGIAELLGDLKSLRSSHKRRMAALNGLERCLLEACASQQTDVLESFVSLQPHTSLLALLSRHTASLSGRSSHTSLPQGDDLAVILIPELSTIISILQGLCLMDNRCKHAVGEQWAMEMFIDLLLLLRSQPSIQSDKQISYNILELFFCVLVDSPSNSRAFEKLSGLEAVVRVLKGSGVTKDVRMKCIEFLYFYLLPEQSSLNPTGNNKSGTQSSTSSTSSLYPPSPPQLPIPPHLSRTAHHPTPELRDVDLKFVPMTPRKPPTPNLGFLTPSTRHASTSSSSTPGLATVPASPGTPRSLHSPMKSSAYLEDEGKTPKSRRMSRGLSSESAKGGKISVGLPRVGGMSRSSTRAELSEWETETETGTETEGETDPFNTTSATGDTGRSGSSGSTGSSGSSTVVPTRGISRSSTQPSLGLLSGGSSRPSVVHGMGGIGRNGSIRRVSPSPLSKSTFTYPQPLGSAQKIRTGGSAPAPKTPRSRHSRAGSSTTSASIPDIPLPPLPSLPSLPSQTAFTTTSTSSQAHALPGSAQKTNPPKSAGLGKSRGFPSELTRGMVPSASSPALSALAGEGRSVLGAVKRVPSGTFSGSSATRSPRQSHSSIKPALSSGLKKASERNGTDMKGTKSVEEKKEMLGKWLGNVEQLVEGVEKVSFWGSVGGRRK